jgi:hypothetical protein
METYRHTLKLQIGMDWTCSKIEQGRRVEKIFEREMEGSRRKGRPKLRWLENIDKFLCEENFKSW